ncbi:MAG TPA: iron ABC transporter permease [Solirubrobacterales bacterium]|nr:iron ABC transporter permease [Solirubrobacterales bacterium]
MSAHGLTIREAGVSVRRPLVYGLLTVALVAACIASLALGAVKVPVETVIDVLLGEEASGPDRQIVETLRLPRMVEALAVGAALGVAGAILQGALANPLASPDVIGVTGGAGFGAILIIILFPGSIALLPVGALFFGLLAAALVFAIAWSGANRGSTGKVILAGIAVLSLFTAGTTGLLAAYPEKAPSAIFFIAGGLTSSGWEEMGTVWPYFAVGFVGAALLIRPLDRLALGDDVAASLGSRPHLIRLGAAIAAALLAAASAAIAGLVGFLGLVVPHVVRMAGGTSSHTFVVPASALGGAALLAAADTLARTLRAPIEMPVGPFMAILGVPLFLWLLRKVV